MTTAIANSKAVGVNLPIPNYPPFKLRSSLIDKDPVIWAQFLKAYLELLDFVLEQNIAELDIKSQQQFYLFLKTYLHETNAERGKIFSLGAINPDIKRNDQLLRSSVFQVLKSYGLVRFNLTGENIWDFVQVYVDKNIHTVRGLIDGTFISKLNDNKKSGNISFIPVLQKHLQKLISGGNFSHSCLEHLSILLGQQTAKRTTTISMGSSATVTKAVTSSLPFAELFVGASWIEYLEEAYAGGKSVNADTLKNVMIVSIISLSPAKLAQLMKSVGVVSIDSLNEAPLLSSIVISDPFKELVPHLEERALFLRGLDISKDEEEEEEDDDETQQKVEDISLLVDLFPGLDESKAREILRQYEGNVELVTDLLLENPGLIDEIKIPTATKATPPPPPPIVKGEKLQKKLQKRSIYDGDDISRGNFSNATIIFGKKKREGLESINADLKKKTLDAALRMMYESDEDEPDDTYDDQEKTSGSAVENDGDSMKKRKSGKLAVLQDNTNSSNRQDSSGGVDETERKLFSLFKRDGMEVFGKSARKTASRQKLKEETHWSDEQIEGWLRMLLKSPKRFKILEEDFLYGSGNPNRRSQKKGKSLHSKDSNRESESTSPEGSDQQQQQQQQQQESTSRNKSKTNKTTSNKKFQHDKKSKLALVGLQSSSQ